MSERAAMPSRKSVPWEASFAALMAPAETPEMMGKGIFTEAGSASAIALSTPTW